MIYASPFPIALTTKALYLMLIEVTRVLAYPKIRKRINWSDEEIEHFISLLRFNAEVVDIAGIDAVVPRDADA